MWLQRALDYASLSRAALHLWEQNCLENAAVPDVCGKKGTRGGSASRVMIKCLPDPLHTAEASARDVWWWLWWCHVIFFFFFFFLGLYPRNMEVPRLGVESGLQLLAYATATAKPDPSYICDLPQNSWECCIPDPLSRARDRTRVLMDTGRGRYCWATMETPMWSLRMGLLEVLGRLS